jgi:hypothetical protein
MMTLVYQLIFLNNCTISLWTWLVQINGDEHGLMYQFPEPEPKKILRINGDRNRLIERV